MENKFISISDCTLLPKIKGVYIIKNNVNNKVYIGRFNCEIEAAIAYNNYILINNLDKELNNVRE